VARRKQDAAQGNAGAENPVAQGTPEALRMPGSFEKLIVPHQIMD
jgi:hypothetical protein